MQPTVLDRLLAIGSLFQRDMHRAFAGTGLTETRVHALWVLHHAGALTQRALVEALGTTPRSVSSLVDGLERGGYVDRREHPTDRRAVLVTLTADGAELMRRMAADHAALSEDLIGAVAEEDRAAFERGIDAVFRHLDRLVRGDGVRYAPAIPDLPEPGRRGRHGSSRSGVRS